MSKVRGPYFGHFQLHGQCRSLELSHQIINRESQTSIFQDSKIGVDILKSYDFQSESY